MSARRSCLRAVRVALQPKSTSHQLRALSGSRILKAPRGNVDVTQLLATPTWSISSLLPTDSSTSAPSVSSTQLRHLLRLSALPPPKDAAEEEAMLATLSSQLHFVRQIQEVDTTGIEPLHSLRDETAAGESEAELGLDALKEALGREEVRGKFHKRIRRRAEVDEKGDQWDVLGSASKKTGRYFVVEGGKDR